MGMMSTFLEQRFEQSIVSATLFRLGMSMTSLVDLASTVVAPLVRVMADGAAVDLPPIDGLPVVVVALNSRGAVDGRVTSQGVDLQVLMIYIIDVIDSSITSEYGS